MNSRAQSGPRPQVPWHPPTGHCPTCLRVLCVCHRDGPGPDGPRRETA